MGSGYLTFPTSDEDCKMNEHGENFNQVCYVEMH